MAARISHDTDRSSFFAIRSSCFSFFFSIRITTCASFMCYIVTPVRHWLHSGLFKFLNDGGRDIPLATVAAIAGHIKQFVFGFAQDVVHGRTGTIPARSEVRNGVERFADRRATSLDRSNQGFWRQVQCVGNLRDGKCTACRDGLGLGVRLDFKSYCCAGL